MLAPCFVVYLVDCLAWRRTLPLTNLRFSLLFRIRWAGESVNNVVPSAYVGGEAVKVWLLRKNGVETRTGATSAVVSKTAQSVAQLAFILCASSVFFLLAQDQPGLRGGILVVVATAIAAVAGLVWLQRTGLFRVSLYLARVLPFAVRAFEHKKQELLESDKAVLGFYRHHRAGFYQATALYFGGWMLDTVEIYLAAHLLGMPITWPQALVVEAFVGVAKIAGMWVPGSLGVQESGIVVMGRLVGFPDTLCVAYALIRRARDIIFAFVGWLFLWREGISLRTIRAEGACAMKQSFMKDKPVSG